MDEGEFFSLADLGTVAINLESDGVERQPAEGVQEAGRGTATLEDGSEMLFADAAFEFSLADIVEPEIIDTSSIGANTSNVAVEDIESDISATDDSDDTVNLEGDSSSTTGQVTSGGEMYNAWQSADDASTQIYIDPNVNII